MNIEKLQSALKYIEDGIKETDDTLENCDSVLQKQLSEQKEHFETIAYVLRKSLSELKKQRLCTETCMFCGQVVPPKFISTGDNCTQINSVDTLIIK